MKLQASYPQPVPPPYDVKIEGQAITYHLTNCSPADAVFIGKACRLFCDPIYATQAEDVRAGRAVIAREPNGDLRIAPSFIFNTPPSTQPPSCPQPN